MSLASTAAAVSLQDTNGAVVNQAAGAAALVTPGGVANFKLQSTSGVQIWTITLFCPNFPALHNIPFQCNNVPNSNLIAIPLPQGEFTATYASTVSDGVQSVITTTGSITAKGSASVPVQHVARVATQAALATYTIAAGVITITANGALAAIDGVTPAAGDLVLLTMGAAAADNGLYQVTVAGTTGVSAVLTRAADWANGSLLLSGTTVEVTEGTLYGPSTWKVMTTGTSTVGTTSVAIYPRMSLATTGAGSGGAATTGTTMFNYTVGTGTSFCTVSTKTSGGTQVAQNATITAGVPGTAKVVLALGGSDTSTYYCMVQNW